MGVLAVAGLLVASCGGSDDDDGGSAPDDSSATSEATDDTGSTDSAAPDATDGDDSGDTGDTGDSGDDGGDAAPAGEGVGDEGEPTQGGDLVFGIEADTANLFAPYAASYATAGYVMLTSLSDPLFTVNDDGEVEPVLVESFGANEDYTEWTFTLRDGISFHDGTPLDGAAVEFNIETCQYSPLTGSALTTISDVSSEGQDVIITTNGPQVAIPFGFLERQCAYMMSPEWLGSLADVPQRTEGSPIYDAELAATPADGNPQQPVGLGAFVFESYTPGNGNSFRAVRNEDYWRGPNGITGENLPYLDSIEAVVAVDVDSRANALRSGQFDLIHTSNTDTVAQFIQVVNEQTLIGVTDGNPTALTALMTDESFRLFAQPRNPFADWAQGNDAGRLFVQGGLIQTDIGDGYIVDGALSTGFKITDRVGLTLSTPGSYRVIEDSATFTIGSIIGVPIKLTPAVDGDQPLLWQITPFGHIGGGGSEDQLSGGLILGGGIANQIGLRVGEFFIHSGQEFAVYSGQPIEVGDFRFETDVDQTIFKGDVGVIYGGFGDNSAYLDAGITYTQFLDDAAIDNYLSPYAAVGFKLGRSSLLRLGYRGDLADGFDTHRAELELRIAH